MLMHMDTLPSAMAAARSDELDDEQVPPRYHDIIRASGSTPVAMSVLKKSFGVQREAWRQALEEELASFESTQTFLPLTPAEARQVKPWTVLPMQVVASEKPPDATGYRRKRCRGVACGNFEAPSEEQTYAGTLDIASMRATIAHAAHMGWDLAAMDVSAAFLNAPLPEGHREVIVRPPAIMVFFGLVPEGQLWRANRAIYGLRISPKAWQDQRDTDLAVMRLQYQGVEMMLVQSAADPAVWSVIPTTCPSAQPLGYVLAYVDDLLMTGSTELVHALKGALGRLWRTSAQEQIGPSTPGTIRYLSLNIGCLQNGDIVLEQADYIREMLERWGLEAANPVGAIALEKEVYQQFVADEEVEEVDATTVRLAQRMAGGLLWVAGRPRPDVSFATSRVASMATTRPEEALRIGKKVLRYLKGTQEMVLHYSASRGSDTGGNKDLEQEICDVHLEVYADAAHEDVLTQTGVAIFMHGNLVEWKSHKQHVVAFSTAESEVNALATGESMGASLEATLESMGLRCHHTDYGDNQAANHIATRVRRGGQGLCPTKSTRSAPGGSAACWTCSS